MVPPTPEREIKRENKKMRDVRHYSSRTPESSWRRLADEVSTYVRAQKPEPDVYVTGMGATVVAAAMLRLGTAVKGEVVPTTRSGNVTDVHVVGLARFRVHAVDRVGGTVMQPAAPRQSANGGTLPIGVRIANGATLPIGDMIKQPSVPRVGRRK